MKNIKTFAAAITLALGSASGAALAQESPATDNFDVTITILDTCTIDTTAADLAFGEQFSTATDIEAQSQLAVYCTPGTEFSIALDGGTAGDTSARTMTGPGGEVPYQLYQDSPRSVVWGEGADVMEGTPETVGTGDEEIFPVYGLVPSANFEAGDYSDTVTVTVTW